ncbi:MAG: DUF2069 domain-containing protein [Gammaproteobacteria bacterium]
MTAVPMLSARLRIATLVAHAMLLIALPAVAGFTGALLALPLLAPARGLWLGRPYTYAWSSMLIVFYVGAFLMEASTHAERRPVALALAVVGALEFIALLLYVRARSIEAARAG